MPDTAYAVHRRLGPLPHRRGAAERLGAAGGFGPIPPAAIPRARSIPRAIALLAGLGLSAAGLHSKSWDEFSGPAAPALDFVFTVCDQAAGELHPLWSGQPMTAHWGVADPAAVTGSEAQVERAFRDAQQVLRRRIELFLALPLAAIDRLSLQRRLDDIGRR